MKVSRVLNGEDLVRYGGNFKIYSLMDWEPEIRRELRYGDSTKRASDSSSQSVWYHLKFMKVRCRSAIQYREFDNQVWTELKLLQDPCMASITYAARLMTAP